MWIDRLTDRVIPLFLQKNCVRVLNMLNIRSKYSTIEVEWKLNYDCLLISYIVECKTEVKYCNGIKKAVTAVFSSTSI